VSHEMERHFKQWEGFRKNFTGTQRMGKCTPVSGVKKVRFVYTSVCCPVIGKPLQKKKQISGREHHYNRGLQFLEWFTLNRYCCCTSCFLGIMEFMQIFTRPNMEPCNVYSHILLSG